MSLGCLTFIGGGEDEMWVKKKTLWWGEGGEQVGLGVVLLFLECSLCPTETWPQWGGQQPQDSGLPLSEAI